MAGIGLHVWHLMPGFLAQSGLETLPLSMLAWIVQSAAELRIVDGLINAAAAHPLIFALTAMALLIVLVVLVQSLAILAFGLDRLLRRFPSRSGKDEPTTEGRPTRRWFRWFWEKPDA